MTHAGFTNEHRVSSDSNIDIPATSVRERNTEFVSPRVWIVSELYYPEETSTGYFLTRIAEQLANRWDVSALCSQPTYRSRKILAPRQETRNGVEIKRCRGTRFDKDRLAGRIINILSLSSSILAIALARFRRGDLVLVVTNPPTLPFLVAAAAAIRGARCVLLVHDVYPDVLQVSGLVANTSWLFRMIDRLTTMLYRSVDRIIVLGRDMRELVAGKLGGEHSRITIIPNWADVESVVPTQRTENPLLVEQGLLDRFVVQYAGNMGRSHDIESILSAASDARIPRDVFFLFIGHGAKRSLVEHAVRTSYTGNVRLLDPVPRNALVDSLNACDVAIVSFAAGMAGVSVPSRMYNILAAGKPIIAIADRSSELAIVVEEEAVGWIVRPGDREGLVTLLARVPAAPAELRAMGEHARRVAEEKYADRIVLAAYDRLIGGLLAPNHSGVDPQVASRC